MLYDYHNSRAAPCVVDYLEGYQGYLQVDGYAPYGKTDAKLAGCMAHARRKFTDAKAVQGKNKTGKADVVLNLIGKLYGIEAYKRVVVSRRNKTMESAMSFRLAK